MCTSERTWRRRVAGMLAGIIILCLVCAGLAWRVYEKEQEIQRANIKITGLEVEGTRLHKKAAELQDIINDLKDEIAKLKPDLDGWLARITEGKEHSLWISGTNLIEFQPKRRVVVREEGVETTLTASPSPDPGSAIFNYRSPRGIPEVWRLRLQSKDVLLVDKLNENTATYARRRSPVEKLEPLPLQPSKKSSKVSAEDRWVATGLHLFSGQHVTVKATGAITVSGDHACDPDGCDEDRWRRHNYLRHAPHGCLIARVGKKTRPIRIGSRREFEVANFGELFFAVNDEDQYNNGGHFKAEIVVQPKALEIDSDGSWLPTGVHLEPSYKVTVEASGEVLSNGNSCDPAGCRTSGHPRGEIARDYPTGALLGRVGGFSTTFLIGKGSTFQPYFRGELSLTIKQSEEADAAGAFSVRIGVFQPKVPVTARRPRILLP